MTLSALARAFINRWQGGFPVGDPEPFERLAEDLGTSAETVIALVRGLVEDGCLSRFGPIYDAARLGGGQTLAALRVPEDRFDTVAAQVNALPAVAHNYRREHALNMWFVVASPSTAGVWSTLREIEQRTGLSVYDFPKRHEFYLGLWLALDGEGGVETVPVPAAQRGPAAPLDATDYRLIEATQSGLPLVARPVQALAESLGLDDAQVAERLSTMLASGVIRRIGAVPNHYRLGLRSNGMTVWDVPDALAVELGERVGALDFVSHAYLRPRHPGVWRYNLFAMVHGRDRREVLDKTRRVAALIRPHSRASDVLFSSRILKKTGLRLAA